LHSTDIIPSSNGAPVLAFFGVQEESRPLIGAYLIFDRLRRQDLKACVGERPTLAFRAIYFGLPTIMGTEEPT